MRNKTLRDVIFGIDIIVFIAIYLTCVILTFEHDIILGVFSIFLGIPLAAFICVLLGGLFVISFGLIISGIQTMSTFLYVEKQFKQSLLFRVFGIQLDLWVDFMDAL